VSIRTIYTIGHSTHSLDEFFDLLRAHDVKALADVRTVPRSRHVPQFNSENLAVALPKAKIKYQPCKSLGGWRHAKNDSINTGWENSSFRGYADYMQTPPFLEALEKLIEFAQKQTTTTMCAEAVPWRCHRSLISDALLIRGLKVLDILSPTQAKPHELTKFAAVDGTSITYPARDLLFDQLTSDK
jgi:uncharacterized protein (DUF488 family)